MSHHIPLGTLEKDVAIIAAALKWAGIIATAFFSTAVAFGTYVVITLHQQETNVVVQQIQIEAIKEDQTEMKSTINKLRSKVNEHQVTRN